MEQHVLCLCLFSLDSSLGVPAVPPPSQPSRNSWFRGKPRWETMKQVPKVCPVISAGEVCKVLSGQRSLILLGGGGEGGAGKPPREESRENRQRQSTCCSIAFSAQCCKQWTILCQARNYKPDLQVPFPGKSSHFPVE